MHGRGAKRELSELEDTVVDFDYPTIEVRHPLSRTAFEAASERQTTTILETLDATVCDAGLSHEDVEIVCCTGGTAHVPRIAQAIRERYGDRVHSMRAFHSVIGGLAERARAIARGQGAVRSPSP